jgi:ABC-type molybdenum transport system ATPase subunit/photorepair protein PhrA
MGSTLKRGTVILHIPNGSKVFRFGSVDKPILSQVLLTMQKGESWALVGSKKTQLLEVTLAVITWLQIVE